MSETSHASQILLAAHQDLIQVCADTIISRYQESLPILNHITILMPHTIHATRMRATLLDKVSENLCPAIIPPTITTLKELFRKRCEHNYISQQRCELLLSVALHDNPNLFAGTDSWTTARSLLSLFSQINEQKILQATDTNSLHDVSEILDRIHNAWCEMLPQDKLEYIVYQKALLEEKITCPKEHIFLCGFDHLSPAEQAWVNKVSDNGQLTIIAHACTNDETNTSTIAHLLSVALNQDSTQQEQPPHKRAQAHAEEYPTDSVEKTISVFNPENLEQHACGLYLKIISWLNAGIKDIAVIVLDRKPARRLSALLKRKHIPVHDHSGWALSTTSAATALSYLFPTTDNLFPAINILNLIRSPFCNHTQDNETLYSISESLSTCFTQSDIVIESWEDANQAIRRAHPSLSAETIKLYDVIADALKAVADLKLQKKPLLTEFFDVLLKAMTNLGMVKKFRQDTAGKQILTAIETMRAVADQEKMYSNVSLWRNWISHTLETTNYMPPKPTVGVSFYNLNQTLLLKADAIIIAGLDRKHTQVTTGILPLSDTDLNQLGLETKQAHTQNITSRLHTLLECADQVLLSYQSQEASCALLPTQWLERLQNFHSMAYGTNLLDTTLLEQAKLVPSARPETIAQAIPQTVTMPKPKVPQHLWPNKISPSSYQSLHDCPYQFFAHYCLGLKPNEHLMREHDTPAIYGTKLHQCISALHKDVPNLPGPMDKDWCLENREYALTLTQQIVHSVFEKDTIRHYTDAWNAHKAQITLQQYVLWLIDTTDNPKFTSEQEKEIQLPSGLKLKGRIDCLISDTSGLHIIDYKSGKIPTKKSVTNGNNVQLGFYALLHENANQASYMGFTINKDIKLVSVKEESLNEIRGKHKERLTEINHGQELPLVAWADKKDCLRCNYAGVCRRAAWQ